MFSSWLSGSVAARAVAIEEPGISPTVIRFCASRPTAAFISARNSSSRGPLATMNADAYGRPGGTSPSVSSAGLEIRLITSIRKPSTPRSTHHRIIA